MLHQEAECAEKEEGMFQITQKAAEMMKDYFKERDQTPSIRIMLSQGG